MHISTITGRNGRFLLFSVFSFLSFWLISCNNSESSKKHYTPSFENDSAKQKNVLLMGVLPVHNPQLLNLQYGAIINYLNNRLINVQIQLVASRSYQDFEKRLDSGYFHIALANPYQAINAIKTGYNVFCKMGDDDKFTGKILVRKDAGITKMTDLKGKTVCFPAPTAVAATMMPLYYMQTHGLDVNKDIKKMYSGSQESSILNVYLGVSSASATWTIPWENFVKTNPDKAAELEVKWETPPLINNAVIARNDVDQKIVQQITTLLLELPNSKEGRDILNTILLSKYEKANNETYKPAEEFLKRYKQLIH